MQTHNVHCSSCDGSGWDSYHRRCLTCEGTGIIKLTDAQYQSLLQEKVDNEKSRIENLARWAKEDDKKFKKRLPWIILLIVMSLIIHRIFAGHW